MQVRIENTSKVQRKLTITVDPGTIEKEFERQLIQAQKTAKLKGFRPGQVPITMVKKFYGEECRHRTLHQVVDDSLRQAVVEHKLHIVGRPKIDLPEDHSGHGELVAEGKSLTYTAHVEVFPEIELKKYSGFSLSRPKVAVTEKDVDEVVKNFLDSQAQIVPLPEAERGRAAKQGDHVDFDFDGKLLTAEGPKDHAALKGTRTAEIGGGQLIPGFEDHLKGMKSGDSKSFTLELPKDDPELGGKSAEFSVKLNEVKQKELPKLDDELAKTWGYEGLADLRAKTKERIQKGREDEAEQRLREQLFDELIKANPFELPEAVIMSHANSLARDFAARLKQQGFSEDLIQNALKAEEEEIKKRAEGQVRAGLLIEEVAKKEKIEVTEAVVDEEIKRVAAQSQMDEAKVRAYYADPKRREDLEYRLRENATVKSMISKSKVKEA